MPCSKLFVEQYTSRLILKFEGNSDTEVKGLDPVPAPPTAVAPATESDP